MRVEILKPFPFSRDGIRSEQASPPEADVPDRLVAGLRAAGLVGNEIGAELPLAEPEPPAAPSAEVGSPDPFDHDGDGKPGGSKPRRTKAK